MMRYTAANIEAVAATLPADGGLTPREIAQRSSALVAPGGIRNILWMLVAEGRACFDGEVGKRRYRSTGRPT